MNAVVKFYIINCKFKISALDVEHCGKYRLFVLWNSWRRICCAIKLCAKFVQRIVTLIFCVKWMFYV